MTEEYDRITDALKRHSRPEYHYSDAYRIIRAQAKKDASHAALAKAVSQLIASNCACILDEIGDNVDDGGEDAFDMVREAIASAATYNVNNMVVGRPVDGEDYGQLGLSAGWVHFVNEIDEIVGYCGVAHFRDHAVRNK